MAILAFASQTSPLNSRRATMLRSVAIASLAITALAVSLGCHAGTAHAQGRSRDNPQAPPASRPSPPAVRQAPPQVRPRSASTATGRTCAAPPRPRRGAQPTAPRREAQPQLRQRGAGRSKDQRRSTPRSVEDADPLPAKHQRARRSRASGRRRVPTDPRPGRRSRAGSVPRPGQRLPILDRLRQPPSRTSHRAPRSRSASVRK